MQYLEQQLRSFPTSGPSGFAAAVRQAPPEPAALHFIRSYFFPAFFLHDFSIRAHQRERGPPVV